MTKELPRFIYDIMASPPTAGEGVNLYLFRLARLLHPYRTESEIIEILRALTADCGRTVTEAEIVRAVERSKASAWKPGQSNPVRATSPWPEIDKEQRQTVLKEGYTQADLWEESPICFEDNDSHTEEIIDALFSGNPLLCCGESNSAFDTCLREEWRGRLANLQLIVPSPMSARTGRTQDGIESAHALANTGPRRFLVVEFDRGAIDEHACLLRHLAQYAPMALAVHSGNKSLHGWFFCAGQPEERVHRFMAYAVSLGADHATWCLSQFVRMPFGIRGDGRPQRVFWFNPKGVK